MTLLDLADYFSDFAIADPDLLHVLDDDRRAAFVSADTEESALDDVIKSTGREFVLALLPYDKKMMPVKDGSKYWGKNVCFLVLKKLEKPKEADKLTAKSQCEVISDRLVKKLIEDRFKLIDTVDQESFYMEPIGPVSDDRYGYICMFTLEDYFFQSS